MEWGERRSWSPRERLPRERSRVEVSLGGRVTG